MTILTNFISEPDLCLFQIKEMMANAQRMIEERKKALNALKGDDRSVKPAIPPPTLAVPAVNNAPADLEKARKIAALQVLHSFSHVCLYFNMTV